MIEGICKNPNCTIGTTGKCLLSHPDPVECPHFQSEADETDTDASDEHPAETLVVPTMNTGGTASGRKFHLGNELGAGDAIEIMQSRYTHLIGILGSTDAGKTCLLSSLYLMASGNKLPSGYQFAGSLTLQAFEDRARGLREWEKGKLQHQLADHTILADPRQPSLLHLAVREQSDSRRRIDLLLTDLPGEWTDNLVTRAANAPSLEFLHRADGIILVVDGTLLMSDKRFIELQHMRQFVERLANDVKIASDVPFVLLVSKSDEIQMKIPPIAAELQQRIESLGYKATIISAAAFSRKPDEIASGTGVFDAIEVLVKSKPESKRTEDSDINIGDRSFQRFKA